MRFIKIKTVNFGWTYINLNEINYFWYSEKASETYITLKSGKVFTTEGDLTNKLAKFISISTTGNISTIE